MNYLPTALEITDVNYEIKGRWIHISWIDGRENSQTKSFEVKELVQWIKDTTRKNHEEAESFVRNYLGTTFVKRFLEAKTV